MTTKRPFDWRAFSIAAVIMTLLVAFSILTSKNSGGTEENRYAGKPSQASGLTAQLDEEIAEIRRYCAENPGDWENCP